MSYQKVAPTYWWSIDQTCIWKINPITFEQERTLKWKWKCSHSVDFCYRHNRQFSFACNISQIARFMRPTRAHLGPAHVGPINLAIWDYAWGPSGYKEVEWSPSILYMYMCIGVCTCTCTCMYALHMANEIRGDLMKLNRIPAVTKSPICQHNGYTDIAYRYTMLLMSRRHQFMWWISAE